MNRPLLASWALIIGFLADGLLSAAEPPALAVLDFRPTNAPAGDAVAVTGFVRSAFVKTGLYAVVDKGNMDRILREQVFQQTGCTSQDCAVKLGKLLNVRRIVVGEYTVLGQKRFLTASLVNVETGRIEQTGEVKGFDIESADVAAKSITAQLLQATASATSSGESASRRYAGEPYLLGGGTRLLLGRAELQIGVGAGVVWVRQNGGFSSSPLPPGTEPGQRFQTYSASFDSVTRCRAGTVELTGSVPVNQEGTFGIGAALAAGVLSTPTVSGSMEYGMWEYNWINWSTMAWRQQGTGTTVCYAEAASTPTLVKPALFLYARLLPPLDVHVGASCAFISGYSRRVIQSFRDGSAVAANLRCRGYTEVAFLVGMEWRPKKSASLVLDFESNASSTRDSAERRFTTTRASPRMSLTARYQL